MYYVTMSHLTGGLILVERGLTWNQAQKVAAYYRRLPENPRQYLVTIFPDEEATP